jgi:hypothetical protein
VEPGDLILPYLPVGLPAITEALAAKGLGLEDVSVGLATFGDDGELIAFQIAGADGALFLDAVFGAFAPPDAVASPTTRAGKQVVEVPSADGSTWLYPQGDTLWFIRPVAAA